MKKKTLWTILAAGAVGGPLAAHAAPVTYDFTGTGNICHYTGVGNATTCTVGQTFTGSVVMDLLASGPSGPDSGTNGTTFAYDAEGWVLSHFTINWGNNTFSPGPVPGNTLVDHTTQVLNDSNGFDQMFNEENYAGYKNGVSYFSYAKLNRMSSDTSWLTSLAFDPEMTLGPGGNQIAFGNYGYGIDLATYAYNYTGFEGWMNLGSLSKHASDGEPPTSVPEPTSFALAGIGAVMVGLARIRRKKALNAT